MNKVCHYQKTTELLKLADGWSSCATIIKKLALEDTLEATTFFPCIFTRSEREIKIIGVKLSELRRILWLHEKNRTNMEQIFRTCSVSSEASVLIDPVDWICCSHIIITSVSFYSLRLAKTWMEFLMDFYNRNRCVAKANPGALLGDVFIKPPIDPGCFFPLLHWRNVFCLRPNSPDINPPRQQSTFLAVTLVPCCFLTLFFSAHFSVSALLH